MVIIHFGSFNNSSLYNGIRVALPKHIHYQSRMNSVCFVNLSNDRIGDIDTQFLYKDYKKDLERLPEPFNKPDIVIFNGVYFRQFLRIASFYSKKGTPYIICPHGSLTKGGQQIKALKKRVANFLFFNRFIKGASSIHYLSEQEKNDSKSFRVDHCFVAPNGVEVRNIQLIGKDSNNSKFLYVGRIAVFHKGLDILINALALIKPVFQRKGCHLDIYGPGDMKDIDNTKKMINSKGLQELVTLHGPVYGKEKEKLLMDADVFVQTSRMEGLPMGVLEALSFGVPVLISRGTNLMDAVKKYDCGWACENDPEELSRLILECINSDNNKARRKNALKCIADNYSWNHVTCEILGFYGSIVGGVK